MALIKSVGYMVLSPSVRITRISAEITLKQTLNVRIQCACLSTDENAEIATQKVDIDSIIANARIRPVPMFESI